MLKFECVECESTGATIYKDEEDNMVIECLSCEDVKTIEEGYIHFQK